MISDLKSMVETASSTTLLKNSAYVAAFLVGLSMESYLILGAFMLIDIITGVARAGVVHGWRSVKSYKLTAGVISKLSLILVPVLLAWAGRGVGIDLLFLAKGTLGVLILAECYSILGNIHSMRIGKDVEEFDAVNFILLKVRDGLEKIIKTETSKKK